ncbi:MAG: hypothetical protein AB7O92_01330 [Acidimicrobiia bacterium]
MLRAATTPSPRARSGPAPAARCAAAYRFAAACHGPALVLVAAGAVFALVFVNWFRSGTFFATGDLGLFLRRGVEAEWPSLWTHENSGAGGVAYTVVRAAELAMLGAARALGGGEPLAERLLFSSMFAFAAAGGAALLRRFCANGLLVLTGAVLCAANLFSLTSLPNYLHVVTVGLIGLLTARAVDAARGSPVHAIGMACTTLPLSYVALNPPLVAVVTVWALLLPFVAAALTGTGRAGLARTLHTLTTVAPLALALNLWWVLPQALAIVRARSTGTIGAQTDVSAWSWTHRNNSLANVMTLRSAWTWPEPSSHGLAATVLGRPSVAWLTWLLPAGLAAAGLLARRHRHVVHAAVAGCVPLWVIGQGLHPPGGTINRVLYEHLPGFWLLREPMTKVGAIPVLAMVLCWALALEATGERRTRRPAYRGQRRRPRAQLRRAGRSAGVALLASGPLIFAWPMLTGQVTRDQQPGRHEAVALPSGWRELADHVNDAPPAGKLLVLPLVDFYQVPTTWGFYGTDTLVRGLVERPVVQRNPQGYLTDLAAYDELLQATEQALLDGRYEAVAPLLRTLGVGLVLVRHDIDHTSPIRTIDIADDRAIDEALTRVDALAPQLRNEIGSLYHVKGEVPPVQLLDGLVRFDRWEDGRAVAAAMATVTGVAPTTSLALTDDPRAPTDAELWVGSVDTGDAIELGTAAEAIVTRPAPVAVRATLSLGRDEQGTTLTAVEAEPPRLGPLPLPTLVTGTWSLGPVEVLGVQVDANVVPLADPAGVAVPLTAASTVRPLLAGAPEPVTWAPVADCHRYDGRDLDEVGIGEEHRLDDDGGEVTALTARAHRACQRTTFDGFTEGATLHLEQPMRRVAGAAPSLCLWAHGPEHCLELPAPGPADAQGWATVAATVTLPPGTTAVSLYRYADPPTDPDPAFDDLTVSEYRPLTLRRAEPGDPLPLLAGSARAAVTIPAGMSSLSGAGGGPAAIGPWSAVGDCNRTDERSFAELGLRADPGAAGSVSLAAEAHSACVHADLPLLDAGRSYTITLPYRPGRGAPPRTCVFDRTAPACLPLGGDADEGGRLRTTGASTAGADGTWAEAHLRVVGTGQPLELYVYADGGDGAGASAHYGRPRLRPDDAETVTVLAGAGAAPLLATDDGTADLPRLDWRPRGGSALDVQVRVDRVGAVIATTESFDPGWVLDGLPAGVGAEHVRLDGYRNGWVVDTPGTYTLRIHFQPERTAEVGWWTSVLAGGMLALFAATRRLVRSVRPGARHRRGPRWARRPRLA